MGDILYEPQEGPQWQFATTRADIAIYGGAAGGGKTFALLMEPIRHLLNPTFGAVIFRRESVQITNEGGLWDESLKLYPPLNGRPSTQPKHHFTFMPGSKITFDHLNRELDVLGHQGAQIPLIGFDELTHFTRYQFFYMLSRNRSMCGIKPYIRATTNPDADSWVAEFIEWWIDQDTGYAIPERSGVIRYFIRLGDEIIWRDLREDLLREFDVEEIDIKSVTFIPASVYDNKALMARNPEYISNLKALAQVERERLLHGNWKIRPAAGMYFPRSTVEIVDAIPAGPILWARGWDLAASEPTSEKPDPDKTACVKIGRLRDGRFIVVDAMQVQKKPGVVREMVKNIASQDGHRVKIELPQDPGQAGKAQVASFIKYLAGFRVTGRVQTGSKPTRAEPFAAQWQAGNVLIFRGAWNNEYLRDMENFPESVHDHYADASASAFAGLTEGGSVDYEVFARL